MKKLFFASFLMMTVCSCFQQSQKDRREMEENPKVQQELKNGISQEFFRNGNMKNEAFYKAGKKEGICREWWEDGKLALEGMYVDGKANGLMKWYSEKGHLAAFGNMIDDKRNGEWKICDWQDSTFCVIGNFKAEIEHGSWKSYHNNGLVARETIWENGKQLSSKCWDKKGAEINCE